MRTSELAKRLNTLPSAVLELLSEAFPEIPITSNTKLNEDQIDVVLREYGPLPESGIVKENTPQTPTEIVIKEDKPEKEGYEEYEKKDKTNDDLGIIEKQPMGSSSAESSGSEQNFPNVLGEQEPKKENILQPQKNNEGKNKVEDLIEEVMLDAVDDKEETSAIRDIDKKSSPYEEKESITKATDPLVEEEINSNDDEDVVIKVPKIILPGLNVKGKIELPTSLVREEKKVEKKIPSSENSRNSNYNPITAKRKREERKAEKLKEKIWAEKKRKKKDHYQSLIKPPVPIKRKTKTKKKNILNENNSITVSENKNFNVLQKFWKWMNT